MCCEPHSRVARELPHSQGARSCCCIHSFVLVTRHNRKPTTSKIAIACTGVSIMMDADALHTARLPTLHIAEYPPLSATEIINTIHPPFLLFLFYFLTKTHRHLGNANVILYIMDFFGGKIGEKITYVVDI